MRYYIFESGSKGNCTLIVSNGHYLIIDNGLTLKKFRTCLAEVNTSLEDIHTVLLTHNHRDHIAGVKIFSPKIIYSSSITYPLVDKSHELIPYEKITLDGFDITTIPTSHDAKGSLGFVIEADGEKLVYITDTGYLYEKTLDYIREANYYIFEANHNVKMQLTSGRPQVLIQRIMGDYGHLSNEDSALYLSEVISSKTKEIVLAHLSEEANTPELALEAFYRIMNKRGIDVSKINVRCAMQHQMISGGNLLKEMMS